MTKDPRSLDQREPGTSNLLRNGVLTYIFALALIGACSLTSHLVADRMVGQQRVTARIVNLTGRQRMLSQRVTRLSMERAAHARFRPEAETERLLDDALQKLELGYGEITALRKGATTNPLQDSTVQQVYLGAPWQVDAQMHAFVAHAHALRARPCASLTLDNPDLAAIEMAVNDRLLAGLNAAVDGVEQVSEASFDHLRRVQGGLTTLMMVLLLLEAVFLYRPLFRRLRVFTDELARVGRTDPLTGCLNRRAFLQEAAVLLRQQRQAGRPLCVAMLDLDRFKSVNDRFGHSAGDLVINAVVATALRHIRSGDLLCRMGGEEFAVLLPGSTLETARLAAERLRIAMADEVIVLEPAELKLTLQVTVSVGLAMLRPGEDTIFPLLARADHALYQAKKNGRNRVEEEGTAEEEGDGRDAGMLQVSRGMA